ncbi:MAG TPA: hypothetical protein VFT50_18145 [Baekduia sp.]|nr:hypothetical protein [Baekduia sp.]
MKYRRQALLLAGGLALAAPASAAAAPSCTDMPQRGCLLPFPNDATQTVKDRHTPTGRRVHLSRAVVPVNDKGVHMDVTDENRADGFSPGQPILLRIPGVSTQKAFARTHLPDAGHVGDSMKRRSRLVLADAKTGKRWPAWADLDVSVAQSPSQRLIVIHPAKNLADGHTYVVALRGIHRHAPRRFAHLGKHAAIFRTLRKAKVKRTKSLYLAWTFTVASTKSLAGRMLAIRDDAFGQLGDTNLADGVPQGKAPAYTITGVTDLSPTENANIARQITGTITVPCYLDQTGCPTGAQFHYSSRSKDALPTQLPGNVQQAPFVCNIPRAATPATPAHLSLYGHGLLGKPTEINAANVEAMSQEHDFVFCATPWAGMSNEDIPTAVGILGDLSGFPKMADRLQQGFLNMLYLGRLMRHPDGLAKDPAFQLAGLPVIDPSALYYDGNSQGAIDGAALTALAPDYTRAVLGVVGMDYATLLPRSTDFDLYAKVLYPAYPHQIQRLEALAIVQLLWDRGEGDGYANHMTTANLPDTPKHTVLLQPAVGDAQVSNWTAEVMARTIGAKVYEPAFDPGRSLAAQPLAELARIPSFPYSGSALVYWDSGAGHNPPEPVLEIPQREGTDPHESPRATPAARVQKARFLLDGQVVDVCDGKPCHSSDWTP